MAESEAMQKEAGSFAHNMRALWRLMRPRRRLQLFATLGLMFVGAVAELFTIGAVLPFLAIAADSTYAQKLPLVQSLLANLSAVFGGDIFVATAVLLIAAAVFSAAARLVLTWVTQQFVYSVQYDLTSQVYARVIRQRYDHLIRQNSSAVVAAFEKIYLVTGSVLSPLLTSVTSAGIASCILVFLFLVDPLTAAIASVSMGTIYLLITFGTRKLVRFISKRSADITTARVQLVQESLGGMREIILDNSQDVFERKLAGYQSELRRLLASWAFLSISPRFLVEAAGIALLALLSIHFSRQPGGMVAAIPVLGALALGAQRMLPLLQQVYLGWTSYSVHAHNLADVLDLLRLPLRPARSHSHVVQPPFHKIELQEVSFSYGERSGVPALDHVGMEIVKGERIGLIGKTGSGKSTLVDVLMGLLQPAGGEMRVDGVVIDERNVADWQAQIAHVPQAIFLADDSIAANIAFGCEGEPDLERVWDAAERANLGGFIDQLPDGIRTKVGERGIRLSGGQRQRIGIARALYKNARMLILDEATSALDDETEAAVMESVAGLERDLTIILIAHRLTTLSGCDRIYRLEGGRVVEVGSYEEIVPGVTRAGSLRSSARGFDVDLRR